MIHPVEEERLRERFFQLREETERAEVVPDFDTMLARARAEALAPPALEVMPAGGAAGARARAYRRFLRAGGLVTAAVAAAVTALIFVHRRPSGEVEFQRLVAAYESDMWRSPTAGLLDVPGIELTRSAPSIGRPARGLDPTTRPGGDTARPRNDP